MKKFLRLLLFGFLSWLVTFAASVCIFPFKADNRPLFETLVGVCLAISTVLFTVLYFRKVQGDFLREGALLGLAFLVCNILLDLMLFMEGPMKMSLPDYMMDIGLAYLSMPVVALGVAWSLRGHAAGLPSEG
ncbi:hypothetical protein Mal4_57510 [Maioricimonas rarisocia]|uniref:Uncharacterized protein n=1 Tax=Maioricimonas rarisocia TaxID=2528026 RepID=A0A517ZFZ4_9PLAN|nr:hypothetical protein [Maioricimonas rarisocia]QDU41384.1 hypothetical protein Mal4_57510 [Maioricimonas rarisocia]